jgi:Cof subfamily protein (haloacid dehalogenase superfamily)
MGVRLVAVDLDGTLLASERTLAPEGSRLLALLARRGIRVVLATTRNPDSAAFFARAMEIDDPMICTNGAQVWGSPTGPVWAYHAIPAEVAGTIARLADAHGWELSTTIGATTYWRQRPGQALGPYAPNVTIVAANLDAIVGDPVRILATTCAEAVEAIRTLCESQYVGQCHAETYYSPDGSVESLCISASGADKGTALRLVLDRLGIAPSQALAIGDNPNDLPMLACAGIGVAMGNATGEVKRRASVVAPSNDEEGVAWALHKFVLPID